MLRGCTLASSKTSSDRIISCPGPGQVLPARYYLSGAVAVDVAINVVGACL